MKKTIQTIVFLFCFTPCFTQNVGIGADAIYNFQTESFGAGARVSIFPNNRLSFVPQVSYYFPFNKVHEYYLGLALEYKVVVKTKFHLYALAHGAYNSWLNHDESAMKDARPNNWDAELGGGISTNKCLRPFAECRYNVKFKEAHARLGLLYIFGCSSKTKGYKAGHLCPAYN